MAIPQQVYPFSLQALYVGVANGDGTWGSVLKLASANKISIAEKHVGDKTNGNSRVTNVASQIIEIEATITAGGYDPNVIAIIEGVSAVTSGGISTTTFTNQLMPFIGICGQAWDDGGGDLLVWLPYAKITTDITYSMDFGKILVANFKVEGIAEPTLNYIWKDHERPVQTAITSFPPVPGA